MSNASGIGAFIRGLRSTLYHSSWSTISFSVIQSNTETTDNGVPLFRAHSPIYSLREQWEIPRIFSQTKASLLHSPHYNIPAVLASRTIVTVHDLIHLLFPGNLPSLAARFYTNTFFKRFIPRCRAIMADSQSTRMDLNRCLGIPLERITVVPLAIAPGFTPNAREQETSLRARHPLPSSYFLYVGNLRRLKNVERLVDAYERVRKRTPGAPGLVLVGRNYIPGFDQKIRSHPHVVWLENITHEELPALYACALALVFPSLYEGFGLPPLEAMASGTPVIVSNNSSLPEVVGDAGLYVTPEDTASIANAMERLLQDASLRSDLRARGLQRATLFSQEKTARQVLAVYEKALA